MISRILRHAAWVSLVAAAAASACTSPPPPPTAFIASYVYPGNNVALCDFGARQDWIDVGTPTGGTPTTVADGNANAGGQVQVVCLVHPSGNGFDVTLHTVLSGQGSIFIQGHVDSRTGATGGITGTFESQNHGHYSSSDCSITYMYNDNPIPQAPVAAGRIWGHLSCGSAVNDIEMHVLPDGGTSVATCDGEADFLFEFCNQ